MKIYSEDGQCFADMEQQFTINEAEAFHKEIVPLLAKDHEFVIHCIDLKEIDTAGIQMLVSLKEELEDEGKIFELTVGKKIKEMISFFQLDDYFRKVVV